MPVSATPRRQIGDREYPMKLDNADRKILRIVQGNCMVRAEELGERCGMSPSTVLRRLRRLREAGVITAETAVVDPRKVGRPLSMIVGVTLEKEDARIANDFTREMRACPAVTQCYFVTGASDYILHISAADMEEFNTFVQDRLIANPHVALSQTHVVINPVKVGLAVPIGD